MVYKKFRLTRKW